MAFFASEAAKPPHHLGHMRPVAHRQDIAVIVAGVGKAVLRPAVGILHRGDLRRRVVSFFGSPCLPENSSFRHQNSKIECNCHKQP